MGNNILTAIKSIVENRKKSVAEASENDSRNRATQMGDALEDYIKNAFADCLGQNKRDVDQARNHTFSYIGNKTNPPDAILRGSDAIEIKKIESYGTSQLQLNSSYPKNKLRADNPKISETCRKCEDWNEKDMLYVIGHVNKQKLLQNVFFVYGDLYCDLPEVYEDVENKIKNRIESLEDIEFAETGELGRVNKVDHLGISDLRVRGMWLIKSPFLHFDYLTEDIRDYAFKLVAIVPASKYDSFPNAKEFEEFCKEKGVRISDEDIADPHNPADLISSKLIVYYC